jgi:8-oxo-dGTP pyrophosphatase MutT (NUDIX family)
VPEPEAAVTIVEAAEPEDSVLLIRRAEREGDPWSGHWSFPGGRRDETDADALATALRELEEECAIRLAREDCAAALPHAIARRRAGPYLVVAPFVFRVPRQLAAVPDPIECAEAVWVPMRILRDRGRHRLLPVPRTPDDMRFAAIDLAGGPLWGFTYRLITDWLELTPQHPQAGFEAAFGILEFLVAHGLSLVHGFETRDGQTAARVRGTIPVSEVLAHECQVMSINRLQVRPELIVITGPAYEEYVIYAE